MAADTDTRAGMLIPASREMTLMLAGKAPDDLVTQCRGWLADVESETLARAITFRLSGQFGHGC